MDLPFGNDLPELDILIVGAGLAGLTSAIKILSKDSSLNMRIIDENRKPGGQLGSNGSRIVNKEQTELIAFLSQLNVAVRQRNLNTDQLNRCWELDRGLTSTPASFELWRYIEMLDLRMKKFNGLHFQFRKRVPTMERHISTNLFFNKSRQFMFNLVLLTSGLPASEINYDEFMCLCSSSGGLSILVDLFMRLPSTLMDVSCKDLLEGLLKKLKHTDIRSGVKAVELEHFKNYVQLTDSKGDRHIAQAVILAIPWNKVNQLRFKPQLPQQFRDFSRISRQSKFVITQFTIDYDKSYWLSKGYSGNFMNMKPLVVGYEQNKNEYGGYMLHDTDVETATVRDTILDLLAEQFGKEMLDPLEYKEEICELNTAVNKPQTRPWHRIVWSSSAAVATNNRNLMGGAVESGIRAAINALFVIRPQVVGWRDLLDVQQKDRYAGISPGYFASLLSRLNLYNITFYGIFVLGLICLLNFGYD
ncbi:probable flavin-containing monoamine oxidase A [Drosophila grimshawi]|nr:probable flavin-containing monoamine oxidase A [Drosophila grimshawi]